LRDREKVDFTRPLICTDCRAQEVAVHLVCASRVLDVVPKCEITMIIENRGSSRHAPAASELSRRVARPQAFEPFSSNPFLHPNLPPPRRLGRRRIDHVFRVTNLPSRTYFPALGRIYWTSTSALQLHRHARERQAWHFPLLSSDARQSLG